MANNRYIITHEDNTPQGGTGRVQYWIAATDAGKPVTGLNVGDLCWAVNTGILYVATSATTWNYLITYEQSLGYDYDWTGHHIFRLGSHFGGNFLAGSQAYGGGNYWTSYLPSTGINTMLVACGGQFASTPAAAGEIGMVNSTAQGAAIASTKLTNATAAGLYRISYFLRCTTADVTAGGITASFTYTDNVGATTDTTAAIVLTATTSRVAGSFVVYLASGDITYLTTLTGIIGTSLYQLRARCEYLG